METSLTGEDQLYQRATELIDCHVNIAVTWSKHDFPCCEIYHSECHCVDVGDTGAPRFGKP